jgi:hypothetical protein
MGIPPSIWMAAAVVNGGSPAASIATVRPTSSGVLQRLMGVKPPARSVSKHVWATLVMGVLQGQEERAFYVHGEVQAVTWQREIEQTAA